ncbi:MAG: hypothetical protein Q4G63_12930 [Bacteroidia bacterium]|nr:hypothetical protein [Bacteroidia bacterium]
MNILEKINIKPYTYEKFKNIIECNNYGIEFRQTEMARSFSPCHNERIHKNVHILPEFHFNIIDLQRDEIKKELFLFSSNATAISFFQNEQHRNYSNAIFLIISNKYDMRYLDFIKSKFPFIVHLYLVFPNNIYGFIDDIKTLLYWKNIKVISFSLIENILTIRFNNEVISIDKNRLNISSFRKVCRMRFPPYSICKTPLIDFKYLFNISKT